MAISSLATYPHYIGLDVSAVAIGQCISRFAGDTSKSFFLYQSNAFADYSGIFKADLALSLDVLFHLVEEEIFTNYLRHLFAAGDKYVLIYASNFDAPQQFHEKRRRFTVWVEAYIPGWKLLEVIPNKYPFAANAADETSLSDFYIYVKQ